MCRHLITARGGEEETQNAKRTHTTLHNKNTCPSTALNPFFPAVTTCYTAYCSLPLNVSVPVSDAARVSPALGHHCDEGAHQAGEPTPSYDGQASRALVPTVARQVGTRTSSYDGTPVPVSPSVESSQEAYS